MNSSVLVRIFGGVRRAQLHLRSSKLPLKTEMMIALFSAVLRRGPGLSRPLVRRSITTPRFYPFDEQPSWPAAGLEPHDPPSQNQVRTPIFFSASISNRSLFMIQCQIDFARRLATENGVILNLSDISLVSSHRYQLIDFESEHSLRTTSPLAPLSMQL